MQYRSAVQGATNKGLAEVVEQEGHGVIGATIDTASEGVLYRLAMAAPVLLGALHLARPFVEHATTDPQYLRNGVAETLKEIDAALEMMRDEDCALTFFRPGC